MRERTKRRFKRRWKNLKEVKLHILVRFASLIALSIIFSTAATILNLYTPLFNTREALKIVLSLMCVCFLVADIQLMRKDYYMLTHKRKYRFVSYISHCAFAAVNIIMAKFFSHSYFYALVFSVTKFARYTHHEISAVDSALIFNIILIIAIRFAPTGMKLHMHHG